MTNTATTLRAISATLDEIVRMDLTVYRETDRTVRPAMIRDTVDCEFGSPTPAWHRDAARERLVRALTARFPSYGT